MPKDGATDDDLDVGDSAHARPVASQASMPWLKVVTMGLALGFLVGSFGYFIGVRTSEPLCNDVDAGFLRDMTSHHDQAVELAQIELARGTDVTAKGFAMEVLMFQRQELGRMQNFQDDCGVIDPEYDVNRETMEWMNMSTPLKDMSGMATAAQIAQLESRSGTSADKEFLVLMQAHHLGGAHMADYEAQHGDNPSIREMAEGMARNQRVEAKEYQGVINRLNSSK